MYKEEIFREDSKLIGGKGMRKKTEKSNQNTLLMCKKLTKTKIDQSKKIKKKRKCSGDLNRLLKTI